MVLIPSSSIKQFILCVLQTNTMLLDACRLEQRQTSHGFQLTQQQHLDH